MGLTGINSLSYAAPIVIRPTDSITIQQKFEGFFDFTYQTDEGKILLEVKDLESDFLYVHSLTTGLGSNDIGLDRGQLGDGVVVRWVRAGNKLLLVQPNQKYRANSNNLSEKKSVEQAFARSVLYGFEIKSSNKDVYTIDLTPFLLEDTHQIAKRLKDKKQGVYKLEKSRSALWMERTKSFPKNTEFEALLTFKGTPTGGEIRSVAPDAGSVSVIQHHSFVKLPESGYQPRTFDPRSGSFYTSYYDYSADLGTPIQKRFITRHRLVKKHPERPMSEPVEPIIYYLDPGTPEPVRSALLEGASWWNQAFESAGFIDAFQVKILPDDADPMDLRYNLIQWVHRSTRGWSYGGSITDPRTGEILKGHVSLGSLRIRQDYIIAQGLVKDPFAEGENAPKEILDMALARIRQLSAHEVGHTLGFAHNFAASANGRASVMDYPHPKYKIEQRQVLLDDAYDIGIGAWDKLAVQYAYGIPPAGIEESDYLKAVLKKAEEKGLDFITDADARSAGGAHATAHLWDNSVNPVEELQHMLEVRKLAMENFSLHQIPNGKPLSELEDIFVPLYYAHRYQTEAAVKWIGGLRYSYADKGEPAFTYLDKTEQQKALQAILETLDPKVLRMPKHVVDMFPPRAYGYPRSRESFKSRTGVAFDPINAAATSADMTLKLLLHPQRLNRLAQIGVYESQRDFIKLEIVLDQLSRKVFENKPKDAYGALIHEQIQDITLHHLIQVSRSDKNTIQVKATAMQELEELKKRKSGSKDVFDKALVKQLTFYEKNPEAFQPIELPDLPDGSPIGCYQNF